MKNIVEAIINKEYAEAKELLETRLYCLAGDHMDEMKKSIAARLSEGTSHITEATKGKVDADSDRKNLNPVQKAAIAASRTTRAAMRKANKERRQQQAAAGREQQEEKKTKLKSTLDGVQQRVQDAEEKMKRANEAEQRANTLLANARKIHRQTESLHQSFPTGGTTAQMREKVAHHTSALLSVGRTSLSPELKDKYRENNANEALRHIARYLGHAHEVYSHHAGRIKASIEDEKAAYVNKTNTRFGERASSQTRNYYDGELARELAPHKETLEDHRNFAAHHFASAVRSHPRMDAISAAEEAAHNGLISHGHVQRTLLHMVGKDEKKREHIQSLIDLHTQKDSPPAPKKRKKFLGIFEEENILESADEQIVDGEGKAIYDRSGNVVAWVDHEGNRIPVSGPEI